MSADFPLDVRQLADVLNHLNTGVYITDRDRRIILWNRKAEEITGWKAGQVIGKRCRENVLNHTDKEGRPLCSDRLCPLNRAMEFDRQSDQPLLVYCQRADGRRIAVSVTVAPMHDDAGRVIGGVETFRDESAHIQDLEFARRVQQHLLPKELTGEGQIEFAVSYLPHDLVGGDFYDVRMVGENRFGILVADVRGHGVSAALYTMWLKSLSESLAWLAWDPERFTAALNEELGRFVVDESFATGVYAVVDTAQNEVTYCNAGHPAPLQFHAADGTVSELESHGMPLGISAAEAYPVSTLQLAPGDMLLFYTDGITEVRDAQGQLLGAEELSRTLAEQVRLGRANLLERIYRQMLERCHAVSLSDDVLLFSVARKA